MLLPLTMAFKSPTLPLLPSNLHATHSRCPTSRNGTQITNATPTALKNRVPCICNASASHDGTRIAHAAPPTLKSVPYTSEMPPTDHESPLPSNSRATRLWCLCLSEWHSYCQCRPYCPQICALCIWNGPYQPQIANTTTTTLKSLCHALEHPLPLASTLVSPIYSSGFHCIPLEYIYVWIISFLSTIFWVHSRSF